MNKYNVILAKNIISWGPGLSRNTLLLGASREEKVRFLLTQLQASDGSFLVEDMEHVYETELLKTYKFINEYEIIQFNQNTNRELIQQTLEQMNTKQCLVFMRIEGVPDKEARKQYELMRENVAHYFIDIGEDESLLCMKKPVMWLLDDSDWDNVTLSENVIRLVKVGRPRNVGFILCFDKDKVMNQQAYRELVMQCQNAVVYTCDDAVMSEFGIVKYPKKSSDEVYVLICGETLRVEEKL